MNSMNSNFQHKKPQIPLQGRSVQPLPKTENGTKKVVTKKYVKELSKSEDPAAFSKLVELSRHPNTGMRMEVLAALALRKEEESTTIIIRFLLSDGHWLVRRRAANMLGMRKDVAAVPALVRALKEDGCCHVKEAAANALGNLKAKDVVAALRTTKENINENEGVRTAAENALKHMGE